VQLWQATVVGIVQGFTEFLPISSSAHIVFAEQLLGVSDENLHLTIIVHLGTLLAVCVALWYRLSPVITGTLRGLILVARGGNPWADEDFRWGTYITIGTVPAVVIGLGFRDEIQQLFTSPRWAAAFLLVTGAVLFGTRFRTAGEGGFTWVRATIVGCAQAFAILPGISRSGATIASALYLGTDRRRSAEFSFLLAIPVILGPALITIAEIASAAPDAAVIGVGALAAGLVAAFVSGLFAIKVLLGFVQRGQVHWFAWYCWIVGGGAFLIF